MTRTYEIREATLLDVALLARHRAARFRDMGQLEPDGDPALINATVRARR